MKIVYFLILSIAGLFNSVIAQTATLHPVKDNTIFSESGTTSNGAGPQFFVGLTGPNAGSAKRRALLQFDLSSIPAGSTITGVNVSVTCLNVPPAATPNLIGLRRCQASWGEGTSSGAGAGAAATSSDATWTCRLANGGGGCTQAWSTPGGDFAATTSSSVTVNAAGVYNFVSSSSLIADVQSWLTTPATNAGWVLVGDEATAFSARGFTSRNDNLNATTLTVTYTSAPCINNTWTGAVSSAWETAGNWSCNVVPDATMNVIINSGTVTLNSNRSCKSISVQTAALFTIAAGFKLQVMQ